MAPLRSLLVLLIFAGLICAATAVAQAPVEWYTDSSGGGATAGAAPAPGSPGTTDSARGGALAPTYLAPIPSAPTVVNLPPPTEMPADDSPPAQAASAAAARAASGDATAHGATPAADGADGDALPEGEDALRLDAQPASSAWDPVPFTSWELAALALAGLCLLVGGAALRPRPARR
jgi:hypothetical protein